MALLVPAEAGHLPEDGLLVCLLRPQGKRRLLPADELARLDLPTGYETLAFAINVLRFSS